MHRKLILGFVLAASLAAGVQAQGPLLGAKVEERGKGEVGVVIVEVAKGSPAEAAGLEAGDVITKIGDASLTDLDAFTRALDAHQEGDAIGVALRKGGPGGEEVTTQVTLGRPGETAAKNPKGPKKPRKASRVVVVEPQAKAGKTIAAAPGLGAAPPAEPRTWLGVYSEPAGGVLTIRQVIEGSPAERAGLKAEDQLLAFDGKPVQEGEELRALIQEHKPGTKVELRVRRGEREKTIVAELGEASPEAMFVAPSTGALAGIVAAEPPAQVETVPQPAPPAAAARAKEMAQMRAEVEKLRAELASLRAEIASLRAEIARSRR